MNTIAVEISLKSSFRRRFTTAAIARRCLASGSSRIASTATTNTASSHCDRGSFRPHLWLGNTSRHCQLHLRNFRHYSSSSLICNSSPFEKTSTAPTRKTRKKKQFIPKKAAVQLTPEAREFFQKLLGSDPTKKGILLDYHQASSGEPRMVFSFKFVNQNDDDGTLTDDDEGVTLEVNEDGTPKTPAETWDDGKPKLYIHRNAFLKVLGATVDVNMDTITPVLTDKEGFEIDPSA